ncbi:MAG: fluoride efflux transporter CrcB [Thiotrichaceae bacterium]
MLQLAGIALGGALGSILRFLLSNRVYQWLGRDFPYGTLSVNILGCLFMGFLFVFMTERVVGVEIRAAILVGFLGGLTTFSSFSMETMLLLQQSAYLKALLNMLFSVVLCLIATWLGMVLARQI